MTRSTIAAPRGPHPSNAPSNAPSNSRSATEHPGYGLSRETVAATLRRRGITPTHQRVEIAHVLFEQKQHLSADRILALVNARHAETSKATVYNTLKLFLDHALIRELIVDPNKVFYDPNTEPHHHFYDVVSGELTDFPAAGVHLEGLPALPPGKVADGVDIVVRTRPAPAPK